MGSPVRRIAKTPPASPRATPRPARRTGPARVRKATPANAPVSRPIARDDRQLIADALNAYADQARLADQQLRSAPPRSATAAALQALEDVGVRVEAARRALAEPGLDAVLAGNADEALIALLQSALRWYLEDLQSSAEVLLACEFGEQVLEESEASLQALSRRMDPLYDAACDLQSRLGRVGKAA